MQKQSKKQQDTSGKLSDGGGLTKEKMLVDSLLSAFKTKEINALVIMEKGNSQWVKGNGITGAALVNFAVDLFVRYPEVFGATLEAVHAIIEEAGAERSKDAMLH